MTATPTADCQLHSTRPVPGGRVTLGGSCLAALVRAGSPDMRIARIAALTAGLAATGAVVGAAVGALMVSFAMLLLLLPDGPEELWAALDLVAVGGCIGATLGAVFGPAAAWLLMRHVPLRKAIGGTALGALAAGAAGMVMMGPLGSLLLGLVGFAAAAVHLYAFTYPGGPPAGAGGAPGLPAD